MGKDFVWHELTAELVRVENERAMRQQIDNMSATNQVYRSWLPGLQAHAREQEHIAATAMMTIRTLRGSRQVPDLVRRAEARRRAESLREQIALTSKAISDINDAIAELENAIVRTNNHFRRMRDDAQAIDKGFANYIKAIDEDIAAYIGMMTGINNSFSEDVDLYGWQLDSLQTLTIIEGLLKRTKTTGDLLKSLRIRGYVGRALNAFGQPRFVVNPFGGVHPRAHREGAAVLRNLSPDGIARFGKIARGLGYAGAPVSIFLNAQNHYRLYGDPGRAVSYSIFVVGGSIVVGVGATVVGAPVVVVAVVGYFAIEYFDWLYNNNETVRNTVHLAGDLITNLIENANPGSGIFYSEFHGGYISVYRGVSVGIASPSSDWVACAWEGRCGT